jgi:broad specificity phosphatase PhoE
MRHFVFARHAESAANAEHMLSSDPARPIALTSHGREQARQLGVQLADLDIDLAVVTSFLRTWETAELALEGRDIPILLEPDLDDVRAGIFDGAPIEAYWSWREQHTRSDRFPMGESLDETVRRYANALHRLLERPEAVTLVVAHELGLRSIVGSDFEIPNATPYLLGEDALRRAAERLSVAGRAEAAA